MSEQKKCPFCGGKGRHVADGGDHWIRCKNQGCQASIKWQTSEVVAWAAWDRRDDAAVKALVDAARNILSLARPGMNWTDGVGRAATDDLKKAIKKVRGYD